MTQQTAQKAPPVALKRDDILVMLVKRDDKDYYGMGRVLTVDGHGVCLSYKDWKDRTHIVKDAGLTQTWGLSITTVDAQKLWLAWISRSGKAFPTLETMTAFVRDFRRPVQSPS